MKNSKKCICALLSIAFYVTGTLTALAQDDDYEFDDSQNELYYGDDSYGGKANSLEVSVGGAYDLIQEKSNPVENSFFISGLQPSINMNWKRRLSNSWRSFMELAMIFHNYEDDDKGSEFINRKFTRSSIFLGLELTWGDQSFLALGGGVKESTYLEKQTPSLYSLEKAQGRAATLKFSQGLFNLSVPVQTALRGEVNYHEKGGDKFEGGISYGVGLKLTWDSLSASMFYHQGDFKAQEIPFQYKLIESKLHLNMTF